MSAQGRHATDKYHRTGWNAANPTTLHTLWYVTTMLLQNNTVQHKLKIGRVRTEKTCHDFTGNSLSAISKIDVQD